MAKNIDKEQSRLLILDVFPYSQLVIIEVELPLLEEMGSFGLFWLLITMLSNYLVLESELRFFICREIT